MTACLSDLLNQSAARHSHLCPRQVLGVRIGLAGLGTLGLESPVNRQYGLIIIETDGCFADGIEVATGATIGHRTLRVQDFGKIAATFADFRSERVVRVSPALDARARARCFALDEDRHYFAQLEAYAAMPDEELLRIQEITLNPPVDTLISFPGVRINCEYCGEEIINEREVVIDGTVICRACANQGYYSLRETILEMYTTINNRAYCHQGDENEPASQTISAISYKTS